MRLALTDDQRGLLDGVTDVLAREASFDGWYRPDLDVLGEEQRLNRLGAEMGWIGITAPSKVGGLALDLADFAVIHSRLASWLIPLGIGLGALAADAAAEARDDTLAAAIVGGDLGVAWLAASGLVIGQASPGLVMEISDSGLRLWKLPGGDIWTVGLDGLSGVSKPTLGMALLNVSGRGWLQRFRLLAAAQLGGLAQTAVAESASYAKVREQFGKPIGAFQAVRHRIADMELRARKAEALLWMAAVSLRDARPDAELQLHAALLMARDAAFVNAEANIQNHGAIGTTTANIGHLLLKRSLLLRILTGSEAELLESLAQLPAPMI